MLNAVSLNESPSKLLKKIRNYQTVGFRDAGSSKGSVPAYRISIDRFFSRLMERAQSKSDELTAAQIDTDLQIQNLEAEVEVNKSEIKRLNDNDLKSAEEKVKSAKEDLMDLKQNPGKYIDVKRDDFNYFMYLTLSFLMMAYLFFFYSSVVYSAFFRDIAVTKSTIYNSIFYSKAIEEAYLNGFTSLMIVILAPIIFIALGIYTETINPANQPKSRKLFFVILFGTFVFDSLLAFHIAERIHNAKAMNSYELIKEFTLLDAAIDANFWMIIAFGFVVYLIFGKVFGRFNHERSSKNKLLNLISSFENKIMFAQDEEALLRNKIKEIEGKNFDINSQIAQLKRPMDKIFFSPHELKKILADYTLGWMHYLKNGRFSDEVINEVELSLKQFTQSKGLDN